MAEEKAPKEEAAAEPKKKSKLPMILGIIGGVVVLEGALFFVLFKVAFKGPAEAVGVVNTETKPTDTEAEHPAEQTEEIVIANQFECPHTNTGRLYVIRMTVYAVVPKAEGEKGGGEEGGEKKEGKKAGPTNAIADEVEKNIASIKDRMRTVIAGADASTLCLSKTDKPDYGLSTLRRQFKTILEDVLGKGKVKEVLISDYMPTPVD